MADLVSGLGTAFLKGEEFIAHINEGGGGALATKFEIEQSTVESQRFLDVTNLERYVIDTDGARFSCCRHSTLTSSFRSSHCAQTMERREVRPKRLGLPWARNVSTSSQRLRTLEFPRLY